MCCNPFVNKFQSYSVGRFIELFHSFNSWKVNKVLFKCKKIEKCVRTRNALFGVFDGWPLLQRNLSFLPKYQNSS